MAESFSPVPPVTLRRILTIALPMVASQASETVMMFFDRLFLSRLSLVQMSAAMSGGLSSFVFSSLFFNTAGYVNTLAAQYYGSGKGQLSVKATSQGIYFSLFSWPIVLLLMVPLGQSFTLLGHSPEQVAAESSYFYILMGGSIFGMLRAALAGYFTGIGKTKLVMAANLIGMLVNIPLNYLFIFGAGPIPSLGITGAAIGTVGGSFAIFAILLGFFLRDKRVRSMAPGQLRAFEKKMFAKLLRFGLPSGVEIFLNVFAFNVFLQLMHSYGQEVAGATTITFNFDMLAFIPMVGLGIAVTSLVGQHMGAGQPEQAKKVAFLGLKLGYGYGGVMMLIFLTLAPQLVQVFIDPGAQADVDAVRTLAATMVRMAAIYTLADVTQIVFGGALRGAGDTRYVMVVSAVLHWIMALTAVVLISVVQVEPLVVWTMFIAFIIIMALTIYLRHRRGKWMFIEMVDHHEAHPAESDVVMAAKTAASTTPMVPEVHPRLDGQE